MAKKNREPRDEQMELARRADSRRQYSESEPDFGMSFWEAQTPIRYLTAKLLERRDRREFERERPRLRAEAAARERELTDSLSRYTDEDPSARYGDPNFRGRMQLPDGDPNFRGRMQLPARAEDSENRRPRKFADGGMVRGTRPVQVSGKNFSGNF